MYVTRHSHIIDATLLTKLWNLYEVSYAETAAQAPTREMLFRSEFEEYVADPTNRLWVLWDDDVPVASTLIATDIGATRYLSRPYFERHYPDHSGRSVVHYIMWVVVHPRHVATGALVRLAREVFGLEAVEGALLVFDSPESNQPTDVGGIAEMASRLASMVSNGSSIEKITTQRYYAVDFATGVRHRRAVAESLAAPGLATAIEAPVL